MGIDFPSSLLASVGQKFTYSGQEYEFNGTAWRKVKDRVTSFNGATGAIIGVTSVQGKTGDVTLTDLEITHGVETFNGLSGSIDTTSLTLPVAGLSGVGGITFSDGTFQPTAARSGFRYQAVSSGGALGTPSSGFINIDALGELDSMTINNTDKEGNDLEPLFQELRDNGGYLEVSNGDFSQVFAATIVSQADDDNTVSTGETTIVVGSTTTQIQNTNLIEQGLDQQNITDIYLRIVPNAANFIRSFNSITGSVDTSSLTLQIAGVTLGAGGITFSDGTQLTSEGQIAFKNEQNTFTDNQFITVGKGIGASGLDLGIRFDANQVVVIGDPENSTNSVKLTVDDNDGVVKVENADFDIPTSIRHLGDTNTKIQFGTDTVDFDAGGREGMKLTSTETQFNDGIRITSAGITFADDTLQKGAAKDVATFTIQASSAITTDPKTNAMYRMPYNATLLGLQGKLTANGNIRGSIDIAGPDFGNPTTGHASAISFQHTSGGNTFDHTSIDQASVDAGDYLYVDVSNNASGATGAQFFVTYETR